MVMNKTGTVDPRAQLAGIDTTNIDSQIAGVQNRLNAYNGFNGDVNWQKRALTSNQREQLGMSDSKKSGYGWFKDGRLVSEDEYNAWNKQNQERTALQNQLNALNAQRDNYIKNNVNSSNVSAATTNANQALKSAALEESGTAQANKTANISAGINRSMAGMLGAQNASNNTANTANAMYSGNRSGAASTQADYLEKMGQSKALDTQAGALSKSAGMAGLAAGLQGLGSGASVGAALATSDENCKTSLDDKKEVSKEVSTEELLGMAQQFMDLYKKLSELKAKQKKENR